MAVSRTRSDTDQTRSNADQSSSEHDQAQADADDRASQRDESVADRDRSMHASTDAMFAEAHAAIQVERTRTVAEREAAADERHRAAEDRARAAEDRNVAAVDRSRAAMDREEAMAALESARIELENAQLDDLTGFYRLGLGTTILQREVDRARRGGGELTAAYCDLDGLKRVNDEQGHAAGDVLLKSFAAAIHQRLRSYDPVVRVGGDEFVCFLSGIGIAQVRKIFGGIQAALADAHEGASVSFGLAALQADDDLAALLERSDGALREAKAAVHSASARSTE